MLIVEIRNWFSMMTSASVWASFTLAPRLGRCSSDGYLHYYKDHLKKRLDFSCFGQGQRTHNYTKIVALQLAIYQRLCLNGRFMRRSVFSHVLLTFFVTLHLPFVTLQVRFVGIYHVPHDIAIIIVRYHTEVDKLVVWSRLSLFRNYDV